jgi:hypothetical protein
VAREKCDAGVLLHLALLRLHHFTVRFLDDIYIVLAVVVVMYVALSGVEDRVGGARKAGLGDIGMVMECTSFRGETMMMDKAGQGDVASRFSPSGESGVSHSLRKGQEKEAEGGAHGRPRRDTIMPLGSGKEW